MATLQRGVQNKVCQRRDVEIQRRDLSEAWVLASFNVMMLGRRDVTTSQRCDVAERVKFKKFSKLSKSEKTP